jgi:two-component system, cell cycle sensor histidine kinase and response regulator CckA
MTRTLRVLNVEDQERDVELLTRHLTRAGYELISRRVETAEEMKAALESEQWDIILCDYSMPKFSALSALTMLKETGLDIPLIIISGTVGEAIAVEAMRAGAHDYLMKDNLARLAPTIERELHDTENRRARRQAEDALKASAAELRTLFAAMTDVIFELDIEGYYLKIAPTAESNLYKESAELIGKRLHEVFPQEQADFFLSHVHRALAEGCVHRVEYSLQINGKEVWFDGSISPMSKGSVIWIARDITERKQIEERLRLQATALQSAAHAIVITDVQGNITWVNPAFTTLTGYTFEEVSGRNARILKSGKHDASFYKTLWDTVLSGQVWQGEIINRRKDKSLYFEDQTITPVMNESGKIINFIAIKQDTTEQRRAEEALRESEERYRLLFESNPHPMWVYDLESLGFLAVNEAAIQHYGYTREEFMAMTIKDIRPADDVAELMKNVANVQEGLEEAGTWRHKIKSGRIVDVEITSHYLTFAGRRAEVVLVNDVTERKRAEKERIKLMAQIESQRLRLNNIVDNVPGIVWESWTKPDIARQHTNFMSDYVETMLGYTAEEWLSSPDFWQKIIHPEDKERIAGVIAHDFATGKGSTTEFRLIAKDGRIVWVESRRVVITDDEGKAIGVRGVTMDITERKRAEQELRQSEERYRELVENAHDIIYSHDLEGNYLSVNKAAETITGYTREESLKMNLMQTVAPEYVEKAREMIERKLSGDEVTAYDLEIIAKDGRRIAVEVNTRIMLQDGIPIGVQGIARDVTERKHLETQLRQSQKMEAIGLLAGGVAHDFNNLLTAITGYSELTLRKLKGEDPLRHNLEEIKKAGERAAALTRQLLAFSRKQVLQPHVLDLNAVVSDMEKMLRRLIGEDIELRTVLEKGLGAIKADPGQIEQVIMNLAVNARDAMPAGGRLTIETENVYLDEEYAKQHISVKSGSFVMLAVSDTGTGITKETHARIFEPFFTTKEAGRGTGLGLSTVYGIVKQSGGTIWVYSEVGQGTTFKVYLPRVDEGAQEYRRSAEVEEALYGAETVLLVEDEEMVRKLARQVLEMYGYQVLEAANGGAALLICERHRGEIALLLTDVVMPEMSGRELTGRLLQLRPEMRVLYMSGYTDNAIVHQGVLDEGTDFIQKPFSPDILARKIREVLDKD